MTARRPTPLATYYFRRLRMYRPLAEQTARTLERERQLEAEAHYRAARLVRARRWQRKAEKANLQVRLALLSVR